MHRLLKSHVLIAAIVVSASTCKPKQPATKPKADYATFLQSDMSKVLVSDSFKFLLPVIDSILLDDQRYRYGGDMKQYFSNLKEQTRLDSVNVIKIKALVARYGWLGVTDIGVRSTGLTLVLQHINNTDREYFLPILLNAYRTKKLPSTGMLGFVDRYLVNKHEQQLFGTDFCLINGLNADGVDDIFPIYNPAAIEERWKKYSGFSTYANFIKSTYKFTWDADEHLKYVPGNAAKLKVNLDSTGNIKRMLHLLDSCRVLMDKVKK
jgi:hypothetical protein